MKILLLVFILTANNGSSLAIHEMPDLSGYPMGGSLAVCEKAATAIREKLQKELWLRSDKVVTLCLEVS